MRSKTIESAEPEDGHLSRFPQRGLLVKRFPPSAKIYQPCDKDKRYGCGTATSGGDATSIRHSAREVDRYARPGQQRGQVQGRRRVVGEAEHGHHDGTPVFVTSRARTRSYTPWQASPTTAGHRLRRKPSTASTANGAMPTTSATMTWAEPSTATNNPYKAAIAIRMTGYGDRSRSMPEAAAQAPTASAMTRPTAADRNEVYMRPIS